MENKIIDLISKNENIEARDLIFDILNKKLQTRIENEKINVAKLYFSDVEVAKED